MSVVGNKLFSSFYNFEVKEMKTPFFRVISCVLTDKICSIVFRIGLVVGAKAFDTHGDSSAGNKLAAYLDSYVGE